MNLIQSYINSVLSDSRVFISGNVQTSAIAWAIALALLSSFASTIVHSLMAVRAASRHDSVRQKDRSSLTSSHHSGSSLLDSGNRVHSRLHQTRRLWMSYPTHHHRIESIVNIAMISKATTPRSLSSKVSGSTPNLKNLQDFPKRLDYEGRFVTNFDISYNQLTVLPSEIAFFQHLESLDLSHNQISELPQSLGCLHCLKQLLLNNNKLMQLPNSLWFLTNLCVLNISTNYLNELPQQFGHLQNLQQFTASDNNLKKLPVSLFQVHSLEVLDVCTNPLQELPDQLGDLKNLKVLNISRCQLKYLNTALLGCYNLRSLIANDNFISELPDRISCLSLLTILELSGNNFCSLPSSLLYSRLVCLRIFGNPMYENPQEISIDHWSSSESTFPTLTELTNRKIASIGYKDINILPKQFQRLFHSEKICVSCGQKMFTHYHSNIHQKHFGRELFPTTFHYCSPHLPTKCPITQPS